MNSLYPVHSFVRSYVRPAHSDKRSITMTDSREDIGGEEGCIEVYKPPVVEVVRSSSNKLIRLCPTTPQLTINLPHTTNHTTT